MKRLFSFLMTVCILLSLSACGTDRKLTPIEKCQQKVVSIGEQYLNYEITAAEACEQLNSIKVPETEGNGQLYLKSDIAALSFYILLDDTTYEEIEHRIDAIRNNTYE